MIEFLLLLLSIKIVLTIAVFSEKKDLPTKIGRFLVFPMLIGGVLLATYTITLCIISISICAYVDSSKNNK